MYILCTGDISIHIEGFVRAITCSYYSLACLHLPALFDLTTLYHTNYGLVSTMHT